MSMFAFFGMPGHMELLIIGAIMLLLFGNRLPSVMRSLGQSVTSFKSGMHDDPEDSLVEEEAKATKA